MLVLFFEYPYSLYNCTQTLVCKGKRLRTNLVVFELDLKHVVLVVKPRYYIRNFFAMTTFKTFRNIRYAAWMRRIQVHLHTHLTYYILYISTISSYHNASSIISKSPK